MLEIWCVALPSGPLPRLFKWRSQGPRRPCVRRVLGLNFRNRGFHSRALLSLLNWCPQVPKSSAALSFGFELLNLSEPFRAIMALLFEITEVEITRVDCSFMEKHDMNSFRFVADNNNNLKKKLRNNLSTPLSFIWLFMRNLCETGRIRRRYIRTSMHMQLLILDSM